ncbi:Outer membrane protein assembly factor YaeT precursor [Aequoribacter fuscus]|uniref:Outer membrane protein assembly factor BamA n=1 Tax=Aequoribacter fuscus TaxID=2518989 RepID=F3KYQ1_9GAMM|nr:outer membrane protein assembly factor BamA [Aequoribacter fuscus]EGG30815.1 Outer membrane protein assembly factor YaeT precursor [Aequoribacter fuscus]QHJ87719.1 outer membrane protein assembly factor BamA [Aequoribacter fuscus]
MKFLSRLLAVVGITLLAHHASAEPFQVSDIRVEGLQRISAGSVFAALPLAVGDTATPASLRQASRNLFNTGNFDDIQIGRDGSVLVIIVAERPSISEINIDGNKAIETEALLDGLRGAGLAVGQVFQRSTLEGMQLELQRQYVQQGRYDAAIETDVIPEPRNRVSVNITIDEGTPARIKHINIVGNTLFDEDELTKEFELKTGGWLSFFTSDDKYSKEKLTGDLEKLTSYYQDRGYLQFAIDSTQVAVSPDKSAVYITANITEGDKFTVASVDLSGDLVVDKPLLMPFVLIKEEQTYNQAAVTATEEYLTQRLGNEGYNFAKVTGIPDINEEDNTVDMKFFIDPGKRTYVRRITFAGNELTSDEVLRREMRQMESAPASQAMIDQSRVRLERLGYFSKAEVETLPVPGTDDLIDVAFTVEEQSSGSISGSVGYAQDAGLILGLNLEQANFLGSGKSIGLGINSSQYQDLYNISYTNPYFTEDGVSRGFSIFYRATDLSEINVASYTTDTVGGAISFGYPIKETQRIGLNFGVNSTTITAGRYAVQEIKASPRLETGIEGWYEQAVRDDTGAYTSVEVFNPIDTLPFSALTNADVTGFLDENGDDFFNYTITASWLQSTLNRGRLATRGASQSVSLELSLPGSDLEFYKLNYRGELFLPLSELFTLRFRTELGYGDGFGSTTELPFFEHFYAGGFGSVRGFENNTLGPRSTPPATYTISRPVTGIDADGIPTEVGGPDGTQFGYVLDPSTGKLAYTAIQDNDPDPFGGNVLIEGSIELLFPMPFIEDRSKLRSAFFIDAGNVFNTNCSAIQLNCFDIDAGELRYSVGVGVSWITGFGPMTFSLAKPMNAGPDDREEAFQFTLGRGF